MSTGSKSVWGMGSGSPESMPANAPIESIVIRVCDADHRQDVVRRFPPHFILCIALPDDAILSGPTHGDHMLAGSVTRA